MSPKATKEAFQSDERAPAGAEGDVARGAGHVRRDSTGRQAPGKIDR